MTDVVPSEPFPGWPSLLSRLFRHEPLDRELARAAFVEILSGRALPEQIAAFAASLRTRGETVEEISGFVMAMLEAGDRVRAPEGAIDTCGTGGDNATTINVSTTAAFVAAGAGATVAKHGGRAASSHAGSADVLEALGVVIELGPLEVERCIATTGIGFCFAPRFHPAMRFAGPVRRALGVPTVFNVLGPLANPAGVSRQVIGVGDPSMAEKMLGVLEALGTRHAIVCYGNDGLDELSTTTTSTVFESRLDRSGDRVREQYQVDPRAFGLTPARLEQLQGGSPEHNATRLRRVLEGELGAQRDIVALNAAAALVVADLAGSIAEGVELAQKSIDSGAALRALEGLIECSTRLAQAAN